MYSDGIALHGLETCTLLKWEQTYLKSFKIWYWRRMEDVKRSDNVISEEILDYIGQKRALLNNILPIKSKYRGHILRRNCLLHDDRIEMIGRRKQGFLMI